MAETVKGYISDERGAVTYEQVRDTAASWAAWLSENGVSRRECVALRVRTDARSGAILLALLDRGQSVLLWRQPIAVESGRLVPGVLPSFCRVGLVDTASDRGIRAVTAGPEGLRVVRTGQDFDAPDGAASPYVYLTTSGTTGSPKIVAYEPNSLLGNARNCLTRLKLNSSDRVMIPVALAHMYGLGAAFLPATLAGASVRLIPDANILSYVRAEAEFEPTVAFLTPTFCHLLVRGRKQARPYRLTVLAGDVADEHTFAAYEQRHGCTIYLYGSTELGAISAGSPNATFLERRDTAGIPLPGVRLAPPDGGKAPTSQPIEQPFPLRFDHPYGCAGYAGRDGTPVKPPSLYQDGWYHTMDLGRVDATGRLQLAGRFDDSVKRDGFLVAFADVERALQRLEAIDRAVVVLGGLTARGRELVAICTASHDVTADIATLRRSALEHLPGHAIPDRFIFVEDLPLTATAKPDRLALAAMVC